MIIFETNFEKIKKQISKSEDKEIIFSSSDDELNRKVLEKLGDKINILLLSQKDKKDFQKQRNSGLNQVLAKIAKSNSVKIGINLDEILESSTEEKAKILSRIKQNIKLCNKYKLNMKFINLNPKNSRNSRDLKSLGLILGMNTQTLS